MLPDLPLFGSSAPPGVRRPVFEVRPGAAGGGGGGVLDTLSAAAASLIGTGGGSDPWRDSVASVVVDVGTAPEVDSAELVIADGAQAPTVVPGDALDIALGYQDSGPAAVFAGRVEAVVRSARGRTLITLVNASSALAALRVQQSFEDQSAGDVVKELARRAQVTTGTIEAGTELSFLVLDGGSSAWQHIARLARVSGLVARVTSAGELQFAAAAEGNPVQTFTWGVDVLGLERTAAAPSFDAVTVWGEGAAGSEGKSAWNWLTKQASPVTGEAGSGARARAFADPALRTAEAVRTAARSLAAAAARAATTGTLLTTGAPAVAPGVPIELKGTIGGKLDGEYLVRRVRHQFDKCGGFRTQVRFEATDGGGGVGGLGGLL